MQITGNCNSSRGFNAKVGEGRQEDTVGNFGLGNRNEAGDRLIEWAERNQMIIGNTWFKEHKRRLWTWKSPGDNIRNQIDYILIRKRFRNSMIQCKAKPVADCNSDHNPVICKLRTKFKTISRKANQKKLNLELRRTNPAIKFLYAVNVKNRFVGLGENVQVEEKWGNLKGAIRDAAIETVPTVQTTYKQKWMNKEILDMMDNRRKHKHDQSEHKILAAEIWFLRRMLRVSYKEHKTNDQVLCEANTVRKLFNKIRQRQCSFIGHVIRGEGMENLVTTGKFPGKRDRGRQREKIRWHM
jgi:hypothetical protein